jgi:hypothetical protein
MQWGTIDVNRELPREWFSPPQYTRTALQDYPQSSTSAFGLGRAYDALALLRRQ